jgi:hypothetical protein
LVWGWVLGGAVIGCQTGANGSGRSIDDCSLACWRIANTNCGDIGEECFDNCVREAPTPAQCATEQLQYMACFWETDVYVCDPDFGTLPTTCDTERNAARACLGLGDASAADAASDASASDAAMLSRAIVGDAVAGDAAGDH